MHIRRKALLLIVVVFSLAESLSAQIITEFPLPTAGSPPTSIVAGPDGNLWFTETGGTDRIGRITTGGTITEFPLPTCCNAAAGIAVGPDGALWFTEYDGQKIGRITTAGLITEFAIPHFASPAGIVAGPDGNLWFTENDGNAIGRITTGGVITGFPIPTARSGPGGIATGPDGNLWFTELDGNRIGRITTAGVITEFLIPTAPGVPRSITAGPDGNLWFTEDANKIGRITTAGVITEFPIPTVSSGPSGITTGPDGNVWFTELAGRIGRITTAGVITEFSIPTRVSGALGIATGPDGNIWFTELAGRIGRLTVPRAPAIDSRILPVVGSTPGVGGSFFRTAVQMYNPTNSAISGRIVFHPSGVPGGSSDPALSYTLTPGQTQSIGDLLPSMGLSGLGSADVEVVSGSPPVATARVFNDAGAAGTTGFTEEAIRPEEALSAGARGVLLLPADLTAFRFNIGVRTLELGASTTLTVRDAAGVVVATVPRVFPAVYHLQQTATEFLTGSTPPPGGSVTVEIVSGSAIVYGATVDNTTGDPSLQIAQAAPDGERAK
jgi:streptogramin lyase